MGRIQRVLVTGGAGFIGSYVVRLLVDAGHDVSIYDSFVVYSVPDPDAEQPNFMTRLADIRSRVRLIRGSTLNKDFLRRKLLEVKPDVIIHMAAMPLAALAIEHTEEAFQSIVGSTHNLLEILRDLPSPCRLVYISSSMVYGDFRSGQVDEDHPKNPKDIYGAFKLAGETIVSAYAKSYGLETVICRPTAVYGPLDANRRVVQALLTNGLRGRPLVLDGDGSMRLDFTYVEDSARAIFLAATHPEARGQTFNVSYGQSRSLRELAEIIQRYLPDTTIQYREAPRYMPVRGTLDVERARRIIGYQSQVPLEEGVRRYLEHLRHHAF
jgi:UDP-glucose 4-epimerase